MHSKWNHDRRQGNQIAVPSWACALMYHSHRWVCLIVCFWCQWCYFRRGSIVCGFCGEAITVLVQYVLNAKRKSKRDKKENPTCFRILRDVFFPSSLHSYSQTSFREEDIAVGDGDDGDAAEKKKAVLKEVEILS